MTSSIQLVSIGPSHYCEKARWGLDRAGILYKETKHVPGFHRFYTRALGQGSTCPKLVIGEGESKVVLNESSDILQFADGNIKAEEDRLYPSALQKSVQEWDTKFNKILGPHVRRWVYCHLLYGKHSFRILSQGAVLWQRTLTWCLMPLLRPLVYKSIGCNRPGAKEASLHKLHETFQEVDSALADGRPYICGDQFTAADLTFAALAGPVLCPKRYGTFQAPIEECPEEMAETMLSLRETLAGKHVLKMYETQRYKKVTTKATSMCGVCRQILPTFCNLSNDYSNSLFIYADIDECPEATQDIRYTPTFRFFRDGERVDEFYGAGSQRLRDRVWLHS